MPRLSIPETAWRLPAEWGMTLRAGEFKTIRTGMKSYGEAVEERDNALATGDYDYAWIWEDLRKV